MASKQGETNWIDMRMHRLEVLSRHPWLWLVHFTGMLAVCVGVSRSVFADLPIRVAVLVGGLVFVALANEITSLWDRYEQLAPGLENFRATPPESAARMTA
jgi:hypothetical protein